MKFYSENKKYFFLDSWIINMFPVGIPRNPYIMISYSATCTLRMSNGIGESSS